MAFKTTPMRYSMALVTMMLIGVGHGAALERVGATGCKQAYKKCRFGFEGREIIPTFRLTSATDAAFTTRITGKRGDERVGMAHSGGLEAEVFTRSGARLVSTLDVPVALPRTALKLFAVAGGSGVGRQTLQWHQRMALRNRCVRVFVADYQTVDEHGVVIGNVSPVGGYGGDACVVFWIA